MSTKSVGVVLAFVSLLTLPLFGQAPTLTASGTLTATLSGVTQQFGPASIPFTGAQAEMLGSPGFSELARARVVSGAPVPGTAGLDFFVVGSAGRYRSGSFAATSDLLVTASDPGVLKLVWTWSATRLGPADLTVSIDIGDDGTDEFARQVGGNGLNQRLEIELGLPVSAGGRFRVRQSVVGTSGGSAYTAGNTNVSLVLWPGASPVSAGSTAVQCRELTFHRFNANNLSLLYSTNTGVPVPVVFLFGFAPQNVPLPGSSCPLLVQLSTLVPVAALSNPARLDLPNVILPPGFEIHAQAALLSPTAVGQATGSLVMRGM